MTNHTTSSSSPNEISTPLLQRPWKKVTLIPRLLGFQVSHVISNKKLRTLRLNMDYLNRAYDRADHKFRRLRAAYFDPEERARRAADLERKMAEHLPSDSIWGLLLLIFIIGMAIFLHWAFSGPSFLLDLEHTTPITWTLDPTCPYHVLASLPGEAFTHAQVTKLDIGWEAAPFPAEFDKGGWRGRAIEAANFYPFQEKLDPHYDDLVAQKWPDNQGVGVALGPHAPIFEFVAAVYVHDPESRYRSVHEIRGGGRGAMIEQVAVVPGAEGGDRLSLPRLLKEGWVVIGKEEVAESKEVARQRRRQEKRSRRSSTSSSGGYACDGDREFERHEAGGWKDWAPNKPSLHNVFNLYNQGNKGGKKGAVPVLTLRHRVAGTLLRSHQRGDAWLVETLIEDHRPQPRVWWKRLFWMIVYVMDPRVWLGRWFWPRLVSGWRNRYEGVADWFVRAFR